MSARPNFVVFSSWHLHFFNFQDFCYYNLIFDVKDEFLFHLNLISFSESELIFYLGKKYFSVDIVNK